ncbi:MAG: hypothetical protein ABI134_32650 [Byssovorax sp.]
MTLFFLLRLLHIAAMILWLGAGLSIPVALDIRRSLALGIAHGEGLVARLSTTSALVIPAGLTTFLTGLGLIFLRGGFSAVPRRIHVAMALTLAIFAIGALRGRPALLRLAAAVKQGDQAAAEAAGRRFTFWVRCEDVLRLSTLALMVLPI